MQQSALKNLERYTRMLFNFSHCLGRGYSHVYMHAERINVGQNLNRHTRMLFNFLIIRKEGAWLTVLMLLVWAKCSKNIRCFNFHIFFKRGL